MHVAAGEKILWNAVTMRVIAGIGTITSCYGAKLLNSNNNWVKVKMTDPVVHAPSLMVVRNMVH